jgi:hypothetical protein
MLALYPALLHKSLEALTKHYFSADASPRYRIGFSNLLFSLDAPGRFTLTPEWLIAKLQAFDEAMPPLELSRHFSVLLLKALDRKQGDQLVKTVLEQMTKFVLEQERTLLSAVPDEALVGALTAASHIASAGDGELSEVFWSTLGERIADKDAVRLLIAMRVLLTTSCHLPVDALTALKQLMSDDAIAGTSWQRVLGGLKSAAEIARLPRFALRWVLTRVIEQEPLEWATFSQVVIDNKALLGTSAKFLAEECLRALASTVFAIGASPMPDGLFDSLMRDSRRDRTGRLLSKLIVAAEAFEPGFVVWLLQQFTASMLLRKGPTPQDVSRTMFSLVAPLRAALSTVQRLTLTAKAHEVQTRYLERRNHFAAVRNASQLEVERKRLATMNIVVSAIKGASAQATR